MSFTSVSFVVFIIAVFLIYWGIPHKFRYILLICANLIFYGSFGIKCMPVLIAEAILAYLFGLLVENRKQKSLLVTGIILISAQLLVFKYLNFTIYTLDKVLSIISAPVSNHTLKLLAPIGISFYTFQALSYVIDVYKGEISPERNGFKLFAYISFFPSITSGPIERAGYFIPQLDQEVKFDYKRTVYGMRFLLIGMLKKICGADVLKQYVDAVFGNVYAYRGPILIVAIVLYTYEIYLDFSGYTDMARGLAYMLGFELTENFKAPYLSNGIKEFFARWHISLSQWLKDYIYIPLGGSRRGKTRKYINLMITMLVSGLWHGASFTFIAWGALHGIYQCLADFINSHFRKDSKSNVADRLAFRVVRIIITFGLVSFAWMFFRANSLSDAKYIIKNMMIGDNFYGQMLQMGFLTVAAYVGVIVIILLTVIYDLYSEKNDLVVSIGKLKTPLRWIIYIVAGVLIVVLRSHIGAGAEFIYFQF